MPEGEEYVSDGSVEWGGVAGAVAGAVLTLVGYAIASWVGLLSAGVNRVLSGFAWFTSAAIATPFEGGVRVMTTAWRSFAEFLPALGPAAFPVAVLTAFAFLTVIFWGVSRIVYGV